MENEGKKSLRPIMTYVALIILVLFILVCVLALLGPAISNVYQNMIKATP